MEYFNRKIVMIDVKTPIAIDLSSAVVSIICMYVFMYVCMTCKRVDFHIIQLT